MKKSRTKCISWLISLRTMHEQWTMLYEAMKKFKKYRRSLKGEIHGASKTAQLEKCTCHTKLRTKEFYSYMQSLKVPIPTRDSEILLKRT